MLSYRHAFHAGNHADVLKHLVQVMLLRYLLEKKDKPLRYIDTHAGAGSYDLHAAFASQNREFDSGITRLWTRTDLPESLMDYVNVVRRFNAGGELVHYPGSPSIAATILQAAHRLQLYELHPGDASRLGKWAARDRRIRVHQEDGFAALNAILPPVERRALVMIDPPYEVKADYATAVATLQRACKKFATGVYALWYPLLQRDEVKTLVKKLESMPVKSLLVELPVQPKATGGMYGSGMFVINPPWVLQQQLESCLPYLQTVLADQDAEPWRVRCAGE
ncbi:MAG: 23S rRNA (adenine(2030)-N(6))-methyltransferase RlmJ [Halioglobus sp.]